MTSQTWWSPGQTEGLLSRKWALVYVFPIPNLSTEEIDASLRFKVQALLPSSNLPLQTRSFRYRGRLYGVVVVDRRPDPTTPRDGLVLAVPLVLPRTWPAKCTLAILSPEGWELHSFDNRVLETSYPPVGDESAMLVSILQQREGTPILWYAPDASLALRAPSWAKPAPGLPRRHWGIPLVQAKRSTVPVVVLSGLLVLGWVACGWTGFQGIAQRELRNSQWQIWLAQAQSTVDSNSSEETSVGLAPGNQPLLEVLLSLGRTWPDGVEVRKLELKDGRIALTARASSALGAVTTLSREALWKRVRVSQIRPIPGGEEFDLEGRFPDDQ